MARRAAKIDYDKPPALIPTMDKVTVIKDMMFTSNFARRFADSNSKLSQPGNKSNQSSSLDSFAKTSPRVTQSELAKLVDDKNIEPYQRRLARMRQRQLQEEAEKLQMEKYLEEEKAKEADPTKFSE